MKKALIILIGLLFLVAACEEGGQQADSDVIKIGLIGPLTGDLSSIGQDARAMVELAVEEANADGGINGKTLEVIYEDGSCTGKSASNAANKLINIDGVDIILGGFCSSETLAVAPMAEQNEVLALSPCSSNPGITDAGDYIFRNYPSDSYAGKLAAEVAANEIGAETAAVFYCLNDFCQALNDVFQKEFEKLGGEIVAVESFEPTARDVRTQLSKIKAADPDMVYFVAFTEASVVGLQQAAELGIDVPMLGADTWDDEDIWAAVGEAGEGKMNLATYSDLSEDFINKYKAKTGDDDVTACVPQAYDAANLIVQLLREHGENPEVLKQALYDLEPYQGVSGTIAFDENGDLENAAYRLSERKDGQREFIKIVE